MDRDGEVFVSGSDAGIGAAFNADAAKRDTLGRGGVQSRQGEGGSNGRIQELAASDHVVIHL